MNKPVIIRETQITRVYLRTGSCPEGRLISQSRKQVVYYSVPFKELIARIRLLGFRDALKFCLSKQRAKLNERKAQADR